MLLLLSWQINVPDLGALSRPVLQSELGCSNWRFFLVDERIISLKFSFYNSHLVYLGGCTMAS